MGGIALLLQVSGFAWLSWTSVALPLSGRLESTRSCPLTRAPDAHTCLSSPESCICHLGAMYTYFKQCCTGVKNSFELSSLCSFHSCFPLRQTFNSTREPTVEHLLVWHYLPILVAQAALELDLGFTLRSLKFSSISALMSLFHCHIYWASPWATSWDNLLWELGKK